MTTTDRPADVTALRDAFAAWLHKGGWVHDPRGCTQTLYSADTEHVTWETCQYRSEHERMADELAAVRADATRAAERKHEFPLCWCGDDHWSEAHKQGWDSRGEADATEAVMARAAESEVAALRAFVVVRFPDGSGDWACAQCHPHSDMLIPGFRCVPHAALAAQPAVPDAFDAHAGSYEAGWRKGWEAGLIAAAPEAEPERCAYTRWPNDPPCDEPEADDWHNPALANGRSYHHPFTPAPRWTTTARDLLEQAIAEWTGLVAIADTPSGATLLALADRGIAADAEVERLRTALDMARATAMTMLRAERVCERSHRDGERNAHVHADVVREWAVALVPMARAALAPKEATTPLASPQVQPPTVADGRAFGNSDVARPPERTVSMCAEHMRWEYIPADLDHETDPHEPGPPPPDVPPGHVLMTPLPHPLEPDRTAALVEALRVAGIKHDSDCQTLMPTDATCDCRPRQAARILAAAPEPAPVADGTVER